MISVRPLLVSMALLLASAMAAAQSSDALKAAQAEQLFREARALMDAEDYAAALTKLEASHKLDPALGTLMNLARCNEKLGNTASAWAQYLEVAEQARRAGDTGRAEIAHELARALEPKLTRLRIELIPEARAQGVTVTLGGDPLDPALLDTTIPYDPGEYEVVATAASHRPWRSTARVTAEGQVVVVEVPALEPEPESAQPESAASSPLPIAPSPPAVDSATAPPPAAAEPSRGRQGLRPAAWVAGGLGVVGLGVGSGVGLDARVNWGDAEELGCADGVCPTAEAQDHSERAGRRADAATGAFVAGGVLLATAVVLYVVGKKRRKESGGLLRPGTACGPGAVRIAF